jgi:hypothetical protein
VTAERAADAPAPLPWPAPQPSSGFSHCPSAPRSYRRSPRASSLRSRTWPGTRRRTRTFTRCLCSLSCSPYLRSCASRRAIDSTHCSGVRLLLGCGSQRNYGSCRSARSRLTKNRLRSQLVLRT